MPHAEARPEPEAVLPARRAVLLAGQLGRTTLRRLPGRDLDTQELRELV